ncbi:ribosomal RNA processing protein 1 homolog A-like [Lethenteron reissneri]|uniref:ribosomal RNA processing protein 1 homolog A-like n=1 Tax=Lethenteron reissneri TaxID=7753 RepID=UPI002AB6A102|nr:ribosomal RNA processing protein 1 homolog A-like [Lethenteron reissneri]
MSSSLRASLLHRDGQRRRFAVSVGGGGGGVRDLTRALEVLREEVSEALTELVDQEKTAKATGGEEGSAGEEADESDDDDDDDDDGGGGDKAPGQGQAGPRQPESEFESGSRQAACEGAVKRGVGQQETSTKCPAKKKKH